MSRYTENKVLFSVPCVYARETFLGVAFGPFPVTRIARRESPNRTPWCRRRDPRTNVMTGCRNIEFKTCLQGTLKTRYFSVYLACVHVKRFFEGGRFGRSGGTPREPTQTSRDIGKASPGPCHRDRAQDARGFSGGLRPRDVFSPAFLLKRRHFSLKKWKRMAYYFNLVF